MSERENYNLYMKEYMRDYRKIKGYTGSKNLNKQKKEEKRMFIRMLQSERQDMIVFKAKHNDVFKKVIQELRNQLNDFPENAELIKNLL